MTSLFDFDDFCEFLDFPSMGFRGQRPPAGQDFEKRHLFSPMDLERARHGQLWTWSVLMAPKLSGPLLDLHAFGPDIRSAHPW